MRFTIPIKAPSLSNTRMGWQKFASLKKRQKNATALCMRNLDIPKPPLLVIITRVGPRKLDDDNLVGACKYIRDQIATIIGIDDGSPLYIWHYEQKIGSYSVEVEITSR